jgi:hypothetical protein
MLGQKYPSRADVCNSSAQLGDFIQDQSLRCNTSPRHIRYQCREMPQPGPRGFALHVVLLSRLTGDDCFTKR